MKRPGWNPVRRNRNIGTKASGHGANNELVIPGSWHRSQVYYEKLVDYRHIVRKVGDREISFYVEPTRPDYFYPCSVDDIAHALSACTAEELDAFDFIVMRQPTRKQRILSPVWGRAIYYFELGKREGAAIVIEAQSMEAIKWTNHLDPERMRELERHRKDGHRIVRTRQAILLKPSQSSLRATVLYRTLFHELGHHIDYNRSSSSEEWEGKIKAVKEDFAHRYAHDKTLKLFEQGFLPFAAKIDDAALEQDALERRWFEPD